MRRGAILMIVLAALPLQGCFFVFPIPGAALTAFDDWAAGKYCVREAAKVGDLVRLPDGRQGRITDLSGESMRCRDPARPIQAHIDPLPNGPAAEDFLNFPPGSGDARFVISRYPPRPSQL